MRWCIDRSMVAAILLALLVGATFATADESEEPPRDSIFRLGEVVVTAQSDLPLGTADSVSDVEMRRFNRQTLAEALDLLPGVTSARVGARNESTIYMRGLDIKHVPIYVDGIPVYVMYDGYADLGRFTTFDLARISVARGAASVLYGPNTMGGAINMISRTPEKPLELDAGGGAAIGDKYWTYGNFGSRMGKWYLQGGASYMERDYFRLSSDFKAKDSEDGGHRENSYSKDSKINLRVGYIPGEDSEYALRFIHQEGKKGTPPYAGDDATERIRYWQWPDWDKQSIYFTSKTGLMRQAYLKTRLYYDKYKNTLSIFDDARYQTQNLRSSSNSSYTDDTWGGSLEIGSGPLAGHDLKAAIHYKKDDHREDNSGQPRTVFKDEIYSLGIEDTWSFTPAWSLVAGISYDTLRALRAEDYNSATKTISDFATHDTAAWNPMAALYYDIDAANRLHLSVARKTRFPTLKDRYSYRFGRALPNPQLDPEKANNYELGYSGTLAERIQLHGALFYNQVRDYILFARVPDPNNPGARLDQNRNLGKVDFYGFEGQIGIKVSDAVRCGLNYTYTERDNRSGNERITDVPRHKFFLFAAVQPFEQLTWQADLQHESERYSSSDGRREAGSYTVINTKVIYELFKGVQVEAGVNNLFDKCYEIQEGYPEEGRSVYASVALRY